MRVSIASPGDNSRRCSREACRPGCRVSEFVRLPREPRPSVQVGKLTHLRICRCALAAGSTGAAQELPDADAISRFGVALQNLLSDPGASTWVKSCPSHFVSQSASAFSRDGAFEQSSCSHVTR